MLPRHPDIWAERQLSLTSWRACPLPLHYPAKILDGFACLTARRGQKHPHQLESRTPASHPKPAGHRMEDFADRTLASKQERLKALAEQLRRLDAELAQRDLALVSTTQLHSMAEHYQPGLRPRTPRLRHASRLWCGRRI